MKALKVMIVDDEILAIGHLKQLINWEEAGFKVVGEAVQPLKGLSLAKQLAPDLLFVDIRMPSMDGLEFSKRLFTENVRCKIILLTAYKEFEYVKEALKIGISDYMVKHELEPGTLLKELQTIKTSIEEERRRNRSALRQFLKERTEGYSSAWDDPLQRMFDSGYVFTYLVLIPQAPFPVMPLSAGLPDHLPAPIWERLQACVPDEELEIAYSRDGIYGLLILSRPNSSSLYMAERQYRFSSELKAALQDGLTVPAVTAAYSAAFDSLDELRRIHKETLRVAGQRWFDGHGNMFGLSGQPGSGSDASVPFDPEALVRLAEEGEWDPVAHYIENCFAQLYRSRQADGLAELCRSLCEILHSLRKQRKLENLEELLRDGLLDTAQWQTVSGIADWFEAVFRETICHRPELDGYSRKVREAVDYISRHYAEDFHTDELALKLGISGDHLRHLFKVETGQTLLDYLTSLRMDKARKLLESGRYKLYEVAEKVGYKSSHYFSRIFQKTYGVSPLQYAGMKRAVK